MRAIFVLLFSLVLVGFCFSYDVDECVEITESGTYDLITNISGAPYSGPGLDACIVITASDVVLDCHGHSLSHDGSDHGIALDGAEDVTVQNCVVHDYLRGTYVYQSDSTTLINNVEYDVGEAFDFDQSHNNLVMDNTAYDVEGLPTAFSFNIAENNTLIGNTAYNVNMGGAFRFIQTSNNVLEDNEAYNISGDAFYFNFAYGTNVLEGNEAYNISGDTFYFVNVGDNTLDNNEAYNISGNAFFLTGTGDNVLTGNEADTVYMDAFKFVETGENTLTGNRAYNLLPDGDVFEFEITGSNVLENNRVYNAGGEAFDFGGVEGDNTVTGNIAHNVSEAFIFEMTGDNTVNDNEAYNVDGEAFGFGGVEGDNTVTGNMAYNISEAFIFGMTGDNVVVENYGYADPRNSSLEEAFIFQMTGDNTVNDNEVHNVREGGEVFLFESTEHNSVDSNGAYNLVVADAFTFANTRHNTVENNFASGASPTMPADDVFMFEDTWNNVVTDNTAYRVMEDAFFFGGTWNNIVEDNIAAGSSPGDEFRLEEAFIFGGTLDNTLTGNSAYNLSGEAFILQETGHNILEDNYAAAGDAMYPMEIAFLLADTGHNTLTGNEVYNISGEAFFVDDTGDNYFEDNIASGAAPLNPMGEAFFFEETGDNTVVNNAAYDSEGIAFFFDETEDNTLENNLALSTSPWSVEMAFIFETTWDNNLTGNSAQNVSEVAFYFAETGHNTLLNNMMHGGYEETGGMTESLSGVNISLSGTLENITGYGGEGAEMAFVFQDTGNNDLTDSEASNAEIAFYFSGTLNNTLVSSNAYEIKEMAFFFGETYLNNLVDSVTTGPNMAFVFQLTYNDTLVNSYAYNASEAAFYFEGVEGDISLDNSTYEGIFPEMPQVFSFAMVLGDISLTDSYSSFGGYTFVFQGISGNISMDSSYAHVSVGEGAFYFDGISGDVSLADSTYEGIPTVMPEAFVFEGIVGETTLVDSGASYTMTAFTFDETSGVNVTNANSYVAFEGAFFFGREDPAYGDNTITDSTSARSGTGMTIDGSNVSLTNHHFYDSYGVDLFVLGDGNTLEMDHAVFDRKSGDRNIQTTLSIDDAVTGQYWITYSYQPDDLPANHGSFAGKFLEMYNVSPTSIDEITWHWDQSEVNSGGYTESEFELWAHDGSWSMVNGSPDTVNNEFTQYGFVPSTVYAILEDNAPATQCQHIISSGTYQMSGDYLGAPYYVEELEGGNACVVIEASDVTFDCRGHRIIGLEEDSFTGGIAVVGPVSDVVVKNCVISGYDVGIGALWLDNAEFSDNDVSDVSLAGFFIQNSSGSLEFAGNTVHNSRFGPLSLGGFRLSYDELSPPATSLEFTDNTVHHLYCGDDECEEIYGLGTEQLFEDITVSYNTFHNLEAPNIGAASGIYATGETEFTDNTAHHLHCHADECAIIAFAAAIANFVEEPEGTAMMSVTDNMVYEVSAYGYDGGVYAVPVAAIAVGGVEDLVTTVTDNTIYDIWAMADGGVEVIGIGVASYSAEPADSSTITATNNAVYNVNGYSFGGDGTNITAFLFNPMNFESMAIAATENTAHHLYGHSGGEPWQTHSYGFQIMSGNWSSLDLVFDNNSIYFFRTTGYAVAFESGEAQESLVASSVSNMESMSGAFGGSLALEEISAVPAKDMEFTTSITNNSVYDLRGNYRAIGFAVEAELEDSTETVTANMLFADNEIHHLLAGLETEGRAQAAELEMFVEVEGENASEAEIMFTATGNLIHHLSAWDSATGLEMEEFECSFETDLNQTSCIITVIVADNTVHHLYGANWGAEAINANEMECESGTDCTVSVEASGNTVHHINGGIDAQAIRFDGFGCELEGNEGTEEMSCDVTATIEDNLAHDVYSSGAIAIGIRLTEVGCEGETEDASMECSLEGTMARNTVYNIVGFEADSKGILFGEIEAEVESEYGTAESTGIFTVAENTAYELYGRGSYAFELEEMEFEGGTAELTVTDNTAYLVHGEGEETAVGFAIEEIVGEADLTDMDFDVTIADNTAHTFRGESLIGFSVGDVECEAEEGSSCDFDFIMADNMVYGMDADDGATGIYLEEMECRSEGDEGCSSMSMVVADNTVHDLLGEELTGIFAVEMGCGSVEPGTCLPVLLESNLVYDFRSFDEVIGLQVMDMGEVDLIRNTVHDAYGFDEDADDSVCMAVAYNHRARVSGNLIHGCTNGLLLYNANVNVTPYRGYNHIYDTSGVDLYVMREYPYAVNISKLIFDSNDDSFNDFTMLSIYDTTSDDFSVDHATRPRPLPEGFISFEGKFVDIVMLEETQVSEPDDEGVSGWIPSELPLPAATEGGREGMTWHWYEAEADGYNENALQLWVCLEEIAEEQGAAIECEWELLNDTPNTEGNMLSLLEPEGGSVFAILHNGSKTPTGDDDEPGDLSMDVGFSSDCEDGNVVTAAKSGGEPLYGATVKVFDADTLAVVASGSTDSNGEFDFSGCGFTVSISVKKGGYVSESLIRSLVTCEECEEGCLVDSDCPEGYICEDGQCVPEPECVDDKDCPKGYECKNGECIPEELECTEDTHCPDDHYCDEDGECKPVTGQCGYAEDHEWVTYACGREEGCPDCPEGLVCENRKCVATGLDCPESVFVGTEETCEAAMNGDVCANCDYTVTDPTGRQYTGKTDENGDIQLPFDLEGLYRVALVKDGEVISEVQVEVVPKAPPTEEEKPTEEVVEDITWLWLLVLLALLAVAFLYWRRRQGEKPAKPKPGKAKPKKTKKK